MFCVCLHSSGISKMSRKQLFICDLLQRREIGRLHRNEQHQLTEASTGLADKLLVHNNVIKVKMKHTPWVICCSARILLRVIIRWQSKMANALSLSLPAVGGSI